MSKKKSKNKKKNTINKRLPQQTQNEVRLSQVMIVKNEEKNIEKALGWAKNIAFEQIVVDTGSTDRTVELAEKLGAKVCHFKWIDDFSAAKNFAMDQATGNWIAILDADEYMSQGDAKELLSILKKIQNDPVASKRYDGIQNSWVQLDDDNNVYSILTNVRIFRNSPKLRYQGRIHEAIKISNEVFDASNLQIMHTGYALTVFAETNKRERNLKLLREENERDPDDPGIMLYLADAIKSEGTEEARAEAEIWYFKALKSKRGADVSLKRLAYDFLIPRLSGDGRSPVEVIREDEALKLCDSAIADLPGIIDYYYYRAVLSNKKGDFKAAREDLQICENAFMTGNSIPETRVLLPSPMPLFFQLKLTAKGLGDEEGFIRNSTILNTMMAEAKTNAQVDFIGSFIVSILVYGLSEDEALTELAEVFDLKNPRDLMLIVRAAKDAGAIGFAIKVMDITKQIMK